MLGLDTLSADADSAAIHTEEPGRDEVLDGCDNEFYKINEIEPKLFGFVEAHQDQIRLVKASLPSRRKPASKFRNTSKLFAHLMCSKQAYLGLDGVRQLARELIRQNSITVTDAELEGAAVLHSFACSLRAGDLAACEQLAPRALQLMRGYTMHSVLHRKWVLQLIGGSREELADASALAYLEYLKGSDQSTLSTQNDIKFWAAPLHEHSAALPQSVKFFTANFPDVSLDEPQPSRIFITRKRSAPGDSSQNPKHG